MTDARQHPMSTPSKSRVFPYRPPAVLLCLPMYSQSHRLQKKHVNSVGQSSVTPTVASNALGGQADLNLPSFTGRDPEKSVSSRLVN